MREAGIRWRARRRRAPAPPARRGARLLRPGRPRGGCGGARRPRASSCGRRHGDGLLATFADITERARAQQQLARREAQLAQAQEMTHLGSWEWDLRTNRVTGRRRSPDLRRRPRRVRRHVGGVLERVHPDWGVHRRHDLYPIAEAGRCLRGAVVQADGSERTLSCAGWSSRPPPAACRSGSRARAWTSRTRAGRRPARGLQARRRARPLTAILQSARAADPPGRRRAHRPREPARPAAAGPHPRDPGPRGRGGPTWCRRSATVASPLVHASSPPA